jgi:hypothetical protein
VVPWEPGLNKSIHSQEGGAKELKNKKKHLVGGILAASMLLSVLSPTPVMAGQNVSVVREYVVTSTDGAGIPGSIEYNEGGETGILHKSKILGYTVNKTRKDPVYRTDTENFERIVKKTNPTKNDGIFPAQHAIDENGYKGNIPRTSVAWKTLYETLRKQATKTVVKDNLPDKNPSHFDSNYNYTDSEGYSGYIPRTSLNWEEVYETLVKPKTVTQKTIVTEKKVPESIPYTEGNFSGTLNLEDVTYNVTKTRQDPVYKTVYHDFVKADVKRNQPNQNNSVFDSHYQIDDDGYFGTIPRVKVDWERDYSTITEQKTVHDVKSGLDSKNDSLFPAKKTYNMDGFTGILERKSVVYETYYEPVYRSENREFKRQKEYTHVFVFPLDYYINEDGYEGYIPIDSIEWEEVWTTGRMSEEIYQSVEVRTDSPLVPDFAPTLKVGYYDPLLGINVFGEIPFGWYSFLGVETEPETVIEEDRGTFHWMSNDPVYYGHGRFDDPYPKNPTSYYGKKGGTGWYAVSSRWISEVKFKDPPWRSSDGKYYDYAKQVETIYNRAVTTYKVVYKYAASYRGQIPLPDYFNHYKAIVNYKGTLSKEVLDYYKTLYEGTATYSGEVSKTVEDGWKGTATYSGKLSKEVIDYYENTPIEWEAVATYSGDISHTYIDYYKGTAVYSGTVSKDMVSGYEGTALYQGSLSKQVIDHYVDTPIEWIASVLYEGYVNKSPNASFDMPAYALKGEPVQITNKSSDPDGNIKSVKWTVTPTGNHTGSLGSSGGTLTFTKAGTYTISLEVTDNDDVKKSTSKIIRVYEDKNQPPVASFTISPNPAMGDDVINYNNTSHDPDGKGIQAVVWTVIKPDGTSLTYTNTTPPRIFDAVGWGEGTYRIRLKVQDYGFSETIDGRTITYPAKWSEEVEKILVITPSLQIQSVSITDIVNPPKETTLPITLPAVSPVKVKAGYKITLTMTTVGASRVEIRFYTNGSRIDVHTENGKQSSLVYDPVSSTQQVVFWFDNDIQKGIVVDMKIILTKTMPDGTEKTLVDNMIGWNFAQIVGSAKEDGDINLTN